MKTCYHLASPLYLPSDLDRMAAKINRALIRRWQLLRLRDEPLPTPDFFDEYGQFADSVLEDLGWVCAAGAITDAGIQSCVSGLQPLVEAVHSNGYITTLRLHVVSRRLMVYLGPTGLQRLAARTENVFGTGPKILSHNIGIGYRAARAFLAHPSVAVGSVDTLRRLGFPI